MAAAQVNRFSLALPETSDAYEAPALTVLGTLHELTLHGCMDKTFGSSDGHTFMGVSITCSSA